MSDKVCVLVPLFNEAKVVRACIRALTKSGIDPQDIYLVDDGSKDGTSIKVLSTSFPISNLLVLSRNQGKVNALITATKAFNLTNRYDWIATVDADTLVDSQYKSQLDSLLQTIPNDVVAICGHVKANQQSLNPLVAYRSLEYFLTHYIYKKAQSRLNVVTVLPGCISVIKSPVFSYLLNTSQLFMLTEDMNWTIRIHKEKLGKIIFAPHLSAYTQDPSTLRDYLKQIHRWYRGLWQVYREQGMYWLIERIDWEVSFLAIEGIFYGTWWFYKMFQTLLQYDFSTSNTFLMWDLGLFLTYVIIISAMQKNIKCLVWLPVFYLIRMLNCFVFLYSMIEIFIFRTDKFVRLSWNKVERVTHSKDVLRTANP